MSGAPLGRIFRGKCLLDPAGEIQAYPFPRRINFSDFHCFVNPSWYQMGRGREVSFSSLKCFSALVKIFPCGRFKKFKRNRAVLTIIIGLENVLCWNLVKSALDKEDSSVPVYSPFNFFICNLVCDVFDYVLCLWIIRNTCNVFNRKRWY